MHLFSPDRPQVTAGSPALLVDKSACPFFSVRPVASGAIGVSVLLRDHDAPAAYSYSYRYREFAPDDLGPFFVAYANDPELCLHAFFGWQAKPVRQFLPAPNRREDLHNLRAAARAEAQAAIQSNMDLL